MYISSILIGILSLALGQFIPSPGNFPATGDDAIAGGIFSSSAAELSILYPIPPTLATSPEAPTSPGLATNGSGPYPAQKFTDALLPNHTIDAPINPPKGLKMPFMAWANGICQTDGVAYKFFLTEIASWGYMIAADGLPGGFNDEFATQSTVAQSRAGIDWAMTEDASKYGEIGKHKIATAGHSCGRLEALSTAYHDERVKRIMLFDISIFEDDKRYLLQQITKPVAWFEGGPLDFTYPLALMIRNGNHKMHHTQIR